MSRQPGLFDRIASRCTLHELALNSSGVCPACASSQARAMTRREDPATSKASALKACLEGLTNRHDRAILDGLAEMHPNGGTKDELARVTGLTDVAVARRMASLRRADLVRHTGELRELESGRAGIVWNLTTRARTPGDRPGNVARSRATSTH